MRGFFYSASALTVLLSAVVHADHDLVFPYVALGDAGKDNDEWKDFKAQVMDVKDGLTTYSVGCATDPCAGWGNMPTFTYTMAIGPNTFDFKYSDLPFLSTHTACTFTGTPATAASCEETNAATIRTSTMGYEHHYTIPDSGTGVWELYNIQSATLRVVDGSAAASTGSANPTKSGSGSSMVTPAPTGTAASASTSGKGASSVASTGAAASNGLPRWAAGLGMGVAIGLAVGV